MPDQTTRRTVLRTAGVTLGTIGTIGLAGAAEVSDEDGVAVSADDVLEPPFIVQTTPNLQFNPQVLVVPEGATVTWMGDVAPHTVTSAATMSDAIGGQHNGDDDDGFDYDLFPLGEVQHLFDVAGEYPYFCEPHVSLGMVGKIIVV